MRAVTTAKVQAVIRAVRGIPERPFIHTAVMAPAFVAALDESIWRRVFHGRFVCVRWAPHPQAKPWLVTLAHERRRFSRQRQAARAALLLARHNSTARWPLAVKITDRDGRTSCRFLRSFA